MLPLCRAHHQLSQHGSASSRTQIVTVIWSGHNSTPTVHFCLLSLPRRHGSGKWRGTLPSASQHGCVPAVALYGTVLRRQRRGRECGPRDSARAGLAWWPPPMACTSAAPTQCAAATGSQGCKQVASRRVHTHHAADLDGVLSGDCGLGGQGDRVLLELELGLVGHRQCRWAGLGGSARFYRCMAYPYPYGVCGVWAGASPLTPLEI